MIRNLTTNDLAEVEDTFFNSFSKEEAPITFPVMRELITESLGQNTTCLGYELDGKIVGAVGFSPVSFASDSNISAYILAPLATHQQHQKKGIATHLINTARLHFTQKGVDALLVYGDPEFYCRYGFDAALGELFIPPYPLEFEFGWQALLLSDKDIKTAPREFTCVNALSDASLW